MEENKKKEITGMVASPIVRISSFSRIGIRPKR
jgi:hypothetical protein